MITITLLGYTSGVIDLYAYYVGRSLDNYVADKVLFTEGIGADAGLYTASVDESKGTSIVAFRGATQPSSWGDAIVGIGWDLIVTTIKVDTIEIHKVNRAASPIVAGSEVNEVWTKVSDTASTLIIKKVIS